MGRRRLVGATVAACSVLLGTACSTAVQGEAVSVFHDPFNVAGMPATDGPSGLRPGAPGPDRDIEGSDGGRIDELAKRRLASLAARSQNILQIRAHRILIDILWCGKTSVLFCHM